MPKILLIGNTTIPIFEFPAVIGRNREQVNITISEPSVSRVHCKLEERNNTILITDLGSSYGTGINENYLEKNQSKIIRNNDILKLGDINFKVSIMETSSVISDLNQTISKKRKINKTTKNSLDEDYVPKSKDSPKLYTEDISTFRHNLDQIKTIKDEEFKSIKEQNSLLILKSISQKKNYFINKTPFVIGSDSLQADLVFNSLDVSKRHLKLLKSENEFLIQNLIEENNSRLNGEPLETYKTYQLHNGDVIDFANQKFIIELN